MQECAVGEYGSREQDNAENEVVEKGQRNESRTK